MPMRLIRVNGGDWRAAMVLAAKWWHAACSGFGGHEARGMGLGRDGISLPRAVRLADPAVDQCQVRGLSGWIIA